MSQMSKFHRIVLLLIGFVGATAQADNIVTVGVAPHGGYVILGGTVIPLKEVTLTAQIPGVVQTLAGEEGDEFTAGAVLVAINDDELQAKKRAAEAQLAASYTAMQNAQVQYTRELWNPSIYNPRPMAGMGMPSMFDSFFDDGQFMGSGTDRGIERHADLVTQGTQVQTAQSRIQQAQASLREIDAKIRDAKSLAPFDGVITDKLVEVGDTVQPGQPLMNFSYSKFLRIQVEVPARLVPGLHKDMVVPGGPGMYAEVMVPDINSPTRALPVVPKSAIIQRGSLPSVRVLDDEGKPRMRLIRTGIELDANHVIVLSGLEPGERVLTSDDKSPADWDQP